MVPLLTSTFMTGLMDNAGSNGTFASSETRLLCMRAKDVTAGSRTPPALEETTTTGAPAPTETPSSADRARGLTLGGVLGLGLMVMMLS